MRKEQKAEKLAKWKAKNRKLIFSANVDALSSGKSLKGKNGFIKV